ncbi:hypothetical protein [Clostridium sp. 3-3]|uniref:hypothetical protein n=1 Tax=Clostridium sp. 3-3 TaxID=2070757 RepID=UPI001FA93B93|nr:hypothetical protein [Clostridium sp. 3-3]
MTDKSVSLIIMSNEGFFFKISFFNCIKLFFVRATIIKFLPLDAKSFALSCPIPELAPVASVYLFFDSINHIL